MKVKICGITNEKDLKTCENDDTAFIGFIHVKRSRRFMTTDKIRELRGKMKYPQKAVLVLEPLDADEVIEKANKCCIKNIQLHSLSTYEITRLKDFKVIRAIGIPEVLDQGKIIEIENFAGVCDYLLFDSLALGQSGGTGKQIPLETAEKAAEIAKIINPHIELFLAGGMNSQRIKDQGKIMERIFHYVDVNSGVENSPGLKNHYKISEFMESCRVI
ncbi:MAG: phosphoribosylanthranilate isomerase [Methanobacterium sp.]